MPDVQTLVWVLTGAITLIASLSGVIWSLVRAEAKEQAAQLKNKADNERVQEMEARWHTELNTVRDSNEKMVGKLEQRHEKEMEQLSSRLAEQIRVTEANILTQLKLMIEMVKSTKE